MSDDNAWIRSPSLAALAEKLSSAPKKAAIVTDYDGTLAPVVDDPEAATPDPEAVSALERLSRRAGLVAVVSGRPSEFLRKMLNLDSVTYVGLYGLERALAREDRWPNAIAAAKKSAERLQSARPGLFRIEDKKLALVLHYRGASDLKTASELAERWAREEARRRGLRMITGKMNVELVPPVEAGKGPALLDLLEECAASFEAGVFIGDDIGDLEAFAALGDWAAASPSRVALKVAVASDELDPTVEHAADIVLPRQSEVAEFLSVLVEAARSRSAPSPR